MQASSVGKKEEMANTIRINNAKLI